MVKGGQRGKHQTLVLLHGFTGDVHAWDAVASHLPKEVRQLPLALPGHEPAVPAEPSFTASCDALVARMRAACEGPVRLTGYSLGARLALGIALRAPELVAELTLIGCHCGLEDEAARRARALADAYFIRLLDGQGIEAFVDAWEAQPIFAAQRHSDKKLLQAQRQRRLQHDASALAASLRSTGLSVMPNYWPKLPGLAMPVKWIAGEGDTKFTQIAMRAQRETSQGKVIGIAGCGHNPLIEAPLQLARHLYP